LIAGFFLCVQLFYTRLISVDRHNGLQSESSALLRRNFTKPTMPRLKNRLHERFAWLIAEGMDRKAAYAKLCPHVADPATMATSCTTGWM
jgi:hypothetical protein